LAVWLAGKRGGNKMENKLKEGLPVEKYNQVIRQYPNNAEAYRLRGLAYAKKGADEQAIADFNQAIQLNPNDAKAYSARGVAYFNTDFDDKALTDFNQSIRLDPNVADTYFFRGWIFFVKRDFDKAIADYSQAIRINPDYTEAYKKRGHAYLNKKDWDRMIKDFDQVIRLNPNDATAYNTRGNAYRERGLAKNDGTKAISYINKEDYVRAIADFDQAIRINPNYGDAYCDRGMAHGFNDDSLNQAIEDIETALRLNNFEDNRSIDNAKGFLEATRKKMLAVQRLMGTGGHSYSKNEPNKSMAEQERIETQRREEEERQRIEYEKKRKNHILFGMVLGLIAGVGIGVLYYQLVPLIAENMGWSIIAIIILCIFLFCRIFEDIIESTLLKTIIGIIVGCIIVASTTLIYDSNISIVIVIGITAIIGAIGGGLIGRKIYRSNYNL